LSKGEIRNTRSLSGKGRREETISPPLKSFCIRRKECGHRERRTCLLEFNRRGGGGGELSFLRIAEKKKATLRSPKAKERGGKDHGLLDGGKR